MRRILRILLVASALTAALLAGSAPSASAFHGTGTICGYSDYYSQGITWPACIPLAAPPWEKYVRAAWSYWSPKNPSAPITTSNGNPGAYGYSMPWWCRAGSDGYNYPHGIGFNRGSADGQYTSHVWLTGRPGSPTGDPNGNYGYCTIFLVDSMYDGPATRDKCLTIIHEYGHMQGWAHGQGGQVMDPTRMDLDAAANTACRNEGING